MFGTLLSLITPDDVVIGMMLALGYALYRHFCNVKKDIVLIQKARKLRDVLDDMDEIPHDDIAGDDIKSNIRKLKNRMFAGYITDCTICIFNSLKHDTVVDLLKLQRLNIIDRCTDLDQVDVLMTVLKVNNHFQECNKQFTDVYNKIQFSPEKDLPKHLFAVSKSLQDTTLYGILENIIENVFETQYQSILKNFKSCECDMSLGNVDRDDRTEQKTEVVDTPRHPDTPRPSLDDFIRKRMSNERIDLDVESTKLPELLISSGAGAGMILNRVVRKEQTEQKEQKTEVVKDAQCDCTDLDCENCENGNCNYCTTGLEQDGATAVRESDPVNLQATQNQDLLNLDGLLGATAGRKEQKEQKTEEVETAKSLEAQDDAMIGTLLTQIEKREKTYRTTEIRD